MPWSEQQRARLVVEMDILDQYFGDKVTWQNPRGDTKVELELKSNSDADYKLRLYLDRDFPNSCPLMVVVSPEQLRMKNGQPLPLLNNQFHTLETVDGFTKLCHFNPELWSPENTLYQVFMKGRLWIEAYEGHLATGNKMDVYLKHQNPTPSSEMQASSSSSEASDAKPSNECIIL